MEHIQVEKQVPRKEKIFFLQEKNHELRGNVLVYQDGNSISR